MESIENAAGFIKANMPLGQGNSLTDQEARDVADRHGQPRAAGKIRASSRTWRRRATFHDAEESMYGQSVDGVVLGQNSVPYGPHPSKS